MEEEWSHTIGDPQESRKLSPECKFGVTTIVSDATLLADNPHHTDTAKKLHTTEENEKNMIFVFELNRIFFFVIQTNFIFHLYIIYYFCDITYLFLMF